MSNLNSLPIVILKKIKGYVGEKIFHPLYIRIGDEKIRIIKEGESFKVENNIFDEKWPVSLFIHEFVHDNFLSSIIHQPLEIPLYITIGENVIYEDYLSLYSDDELGIDLESYFDETFFCDVEPKIIEGLELLGEIYEYK